MVARILAVVYERVRQRLLRIAFARPADITKLAREIRYKQLPYGYALEFFDGSCYSEAEYLIKCLRGRISAPESDRLHVVVVVHVAGSAAMLTFLPVSWDQQLRLRFPEEIQRIQDLTCAGSRVRGDSVAPANRVRREDFLLSCSHDTSELIKTIEQHFGRELKCIFGGNTMTVNRRSGGKLLRITKALNCVSNLDTTVGNELTALPGANATFS